MAKTTTVYECSTCHSQSPVKMGKCPRCGSWGTMEAKIEEKVAVSRTTRRALESTVVQSLSEVTSAGLTRVTSGLEEVDRVLGGGWVAGGVLLLAGEPGIGKSTLLLQLAHHALILQTQSASRSVLYVAGEESLSQVKMRAERLGVAPTLQLTRETDARALSDYLRFHAPDLIIVDSIQTLLATDDGVPGSITQVRDATALLTSVAKEIDATLVLIGHVTKEGTIAGPKVIEHMVDTTLALETAAGFRVLRAIKNRFGPAGEMGVFEMAGEGMKPIANPSEAFLAERPKGVAGSVVVAALEGQRPMLLEVQALAAKSPYTSPRRIVQGLDQRRVDVVLAVLERRLELPLAGLDVYVNVAGGLRLTDPGTDLAVAVAVYSAITNKTVPEGVAVVGEVGLAGEIRSVTQLPRRASEAKRAGFERVVAPSNDKKGITSLSEALNAVWK
ncbi:MAG: DNA repair protein RadA [Trueperaceae bacterium]